LCFLRHDRLLLHLHSFPTRRSSDLEQRNVASPWQAKREQRIKICVQRFCGSFGNRNTGHWIKSKSRTRSGMAQRDGTKSAAPSAIWNKKAKSRAFEKIGTSCPTQPISSPEP